MIKNSQSFFEVYSIPYIYIYMDRKKVKYTPQHLKRKIETLNTQYTVISFTGYVKKLYIWDAFWQI